jgi:hypothetical protein
MLTCNFLELMWTKIMTSILNSKTTIIAVNYVDGTVIELTSFNVWDSCIFTKEIAFSSGRKEYSTLRKGETVREEGIVRSIMSSCSSCSLQNSAQRNKDRATDETHFKRSAFMQRVLHLRGRLSSNWHIMQQHSLGERKCILNKANDSDTSWNILEPDSFKTVMMIIIIYILLND